MQVWIAVFVAGGLGSALRFGIGLASGRWLGAFPTGTLLANILGSFLIGFLGVLAVEKGMIPTPYREAILVGFLGGLTTFSSFLLDISKLVESKMILTAILYYLANILIGLILLWVGRFIGRS